MTLELPIILLSLGLILALARLIRGPGLPRRVLSFDPLTTIGIGLMAERVYILASRTANQLLSPVDCVTAVLGVSP